MTDADLYWLAGLLEGEGSFVAGPPSNPGCPQVCLQMVDEDVVARIAKLFAKKYWRCVPKNVRHSPTYKTYLRGLRAVELMHTLRPLMGRRRQGQIDVAIASHRTDPTHWRYRERIPGAAVIKLRKRGWSYRKIAAHLGCSYQLVHKRLALYASGEAATLSR